MTEEVSQFEIKIISLAKRTLVRAEQSLQEASLSPQIDEPKRENIGKQDYYSEIAIYFYDGNSFVDVIEFFIYRNGKPVASLSEFEEWLQKTLDDVISRRRRGTV